MRRLLFAVLLCLPLLGQASFDDCKDYFPGGVAPVTPNYPLLRELCFDSFAVLHSGESKTPVYAVERLNRARILAAKGRPRTDKFYEEARLPFAHRAKLADYRGSMLDRGHQAPSADFHTEEGMAQSFSLANMVPQSPQQNRGIWAKNVEKATREYVLRAQGDVFVFTGPAFTQTPVGTIGAGKVWVPDYLFKLVYDPTTRKAWAHWVENSDTARMTRPIPYTELVKRTGIEFLPGITLL